MGATKIGDGLQQSAAVTGAADALVRALEEGVRAEVAEHEELLSRLETAARGGALFAGWRRTEWGKA